MLKAMLLSGSQQSTLLVLCCQLEEEEEEGSSGTLSALEVADKLDLCSLNHPCMAYTMILQNEN